MESAVWPLELVTILGALTGQGGGHYGLGVVEQVKSFKMFQDGQFWIDVTALMNIY